MTLPLAVFTYLVVWSITLFLFLPVRKLTLKRKTQWNTLLAALITLGIYLLLESGSIPVRGG